MAVRGAFAPPRRWSARLPACQGPERHKPGPEKGGGPWPPSSCCLLAFRRMPCFRWSRPSRALTLGSRPLSHERILLHTVLKLSGSGAVRSFCQRSLSGTQGSDEVLPIRRPTFRIIRSRMYHSAFPHPASDPSREQSQGASRRRNTWISSPVVLDCLWPRSRLSKTRASQMGTAGSLGSGVASSSLGFETCLPLAVRFPIRGSGPGQAGRSGHPVFAIMTPLCTDPGILACAWGPGSASRHLAEHEVPARLRAIEECSACCRPPPCQPKRKIRPAKAATFLSSLFMFPSISGVHTHLAGPCF